MIFANVALWSCLVLPGEVPLTDGVIAGVVLNRSADRAPVAGAQVALRLQSDQQPVVIGETTTDYRGRFHFEHLPVGNAYRYLPGANRDGVHYPGGAVELTAQQPHAESEVVVCDSVAEPCPLTIRRHEIIIRPMPGALRVSESIVVANPTNNTYVGRSAGKDAEPVTLQLHIPSDFERVTFAQEFFGRRFSIDKGSLVTSIPWTPGERTLRFTYVLRNAQRGRTWERTLDLPCEQLRVAVEGIAANEITCNLATEPGSGAKPVFASIGQTLPAGHRIAVQLGQLPVLWTDYARWLSPVVLAVLVGAAAMVLLRRRHAREPLIDRRRVPQPHFLPAHLGGSRPSRRVPISTRRRG